MLSEAVKGWAQNCKDKKQKQKIEEIKITMKNYKTSIAIAALAVAGFAQISQAVPPPVFPTGPGLYLYDEATGASAFVAATGGFAGFLGTVGDYSVHVSATGSTIQGGSNPQLDLDVASAVAGAGATKLDVYYSDGTFGPTTGGYILQTTGPASGGPVFTSAGISSTVFGNASNLGGSTDVFPYTLNATGGITSTSYYLTIEDSITGSMTSIDSSITVVPETTTVVAAALMLLPLGIGAVRSLRKEQASA